MGKKKNKVILPPQLPPELAEEEIVVSDEDIEFVKENRAYAGFLKNLDTNVITRHVARVADQKEDALESLYEKRNKKSSLQKQAEEDGIKVDRVDALPVKTLDGQLYYRTAPATSKEGKRSEKIATEEVILDDKNDEKDKSMVKITKAEKRAKLKKSRKEAKNQAKEKTNIDKVEDNLQTEVLEWELLTRELLLSVPVSGATQGQIFNILGEPVDNLAPAEVKQELSAEGVFADKKSKLAEIGMALLAEPEANIKSLKDLLQLCEDEDPNVVKLGLLSLLAIFKDIIPGYRIRLPTEKELQMTVSKEVRKMRYYESTLLSSYKVYLQKLVSLQTMPSYYHVTTRCMCNLLEAVPHFNFYETLLSNVVKNLSSPDDVIRKVCCSTLKSLFANEGKHGGEATVEAVHLIADLVKSHDCQLHPDCIEVFLSLSFDENIAKRAAAEAEEKVKQKKKKRRQNDEGPSKLPVSDKKRSRQEMMAKTREEVDADFRSASFVPDKDESRRMQSDTLSAVFQTYFRVLRRTMAPTSMPIRKTNVDSLPPGLGMHPLLAPCLKGLGKFSHLIDLDFMGDLMNALKKLASSGSINGVVSHENCLTVSERLQCCIVAFKVMRNNLDALNVDLQEFFIQLYNLLIEYNPDRENKGEVLAEALRIMLCEGRQHDMQRAAAFIKRLATFCLCFGSAEAMAGLVTLRHLLHMNIKCRNLLENDAGGGSLSGSIAQYSVLERGNRYESVFARESVAYLCGHLHAKFSNKLWRLHSIGLTYMSQQIEKLCQFWEWELGDWKESRLMRILSIDRGEVSFVDIKLANESVGDFSTTVLITHPPDSRSMNRLVSQSRVSRNDISALVFSAKHVLNVTAKFFDASRSFRLVEQLQLHASASSNHGCLFHAKWNISNYKNASGTRFWLLVVVDVHGMETSTTPSPFSVEGKLAHLPKTWLAHLIFHIKWESLYLSLLWSNVSILMLLLFLPKLLSHFVERNPSYQKWAMSIYNFWPIKQRMSFFGPLWFLIEGSRDRRLWCAMVLYLLYLLKFSWFWGHATSEHDAVSSMSIRGWTVKFLNVLMREEVIGIPDIMTITLPFLYLIVCPLYLLIYSLLAERSVFSLHTSKKMDTEPSKKSPDVSSSKFSNGTKASVCKICRGWIRTALLLCCFVFVCLHIRKYQPDATDPNLSGALASVLWELSLLSKHYHPTISSMASSISSMGTTHNQVYHSIVSPVQAFADLSIERESFKPSSNFVTTNHKRKWGNRSTTILSSKGICETVVPVDEDELEKKFSHHFSVLNDITENERLRRDLNRTLSSLSLYEEYKKQKKKLVGSKNRKEKTLKA